MRNKTKMPRTTRNHIVEAGARSGWRVELRENEDLYKKLITLKKSGKTICVDKDVGFTAAGELKYLKVAIHPDEYRVARINAGAGVEAMVNRTTGKNWFQHSGYSSFSAVGDTGEPAAMAYKVRDQSAFEAFLKNFD